MATSTIEVSPRELAAWPGFDQSVTELRRDTEVGYFAHLPNSYSVEQYQRLHDSGQLICLIHTDDDKRLLGWANLLLTIVPRRAGYLLVMDTMWASSSLIGGRLLKTFEDYAERYNAPLCITAPIGGSLHRLLAKRFQPSHEVFTLSGGQ